MFDIASDLPWRRARPVDKAGDTLREHAQSAALLVSALAGAARRGAEIRARKARRRRPPYVALALLAGAGVALVAYRPTRQALGATAAGVRRLPLGAFGRQLAKELKSLVPQRSET